MTLVVKYKYKLSLYILLLINSSLDVPGKPADMTRPYAGTTAQMGNNGIYHVLGDKVLSQTTYQPWWRVDLEMLRCVSAVVIYFFYSKCLHVKYGIITLKLICQVTQFFYNCYFLFIIY